MLLRKLRYGGQSHSCSTSEVLVETVSGVEGAFYIFDS